MADFLEQKRTELTSRLAELKPLVEEYGRLEQAVAALGAIPALPASASGGAAAPGAAAPRRRGRPPGPKRKAPAASSSSPRAKAAKPATKRATRGGGRRKGSGKRGGEALAHITEKPGITIPELAARMGIKQNYLYRVLPTLEEAGSVAKQGRGWFPKQPVA